MLVNYIMWQVVNHYIDAAPSVFVAAKKKFTDAIFGDTKEKPRWKTCLGQMAKPFEMPLGLLFVDATYKNDMTDVVSTCSGNKDDTSWTRQNEQETIRPDHAD